MRWKKSHKTPICYARQLGKAKVRYLHIPTFLLKNQVDGKKIILKYLDICISLKELSGSDQELLNSYCYCVEFW